MTGVIIHNPAMVLILAVIIAATISVGTAILVLYFKDRERAQFVYSIILVTLIGESYFLDPSPFSMITRLATGDPGIGTPNVALYTIPFIIIAALFFNVFQRLVLARR